MAKKGGVDVKFFVKKYERKMQQNVVKTAREAARQVRDIVRALAPEDEGTLAKAIKDEVRKHKTGVSAFIGVDRKAVNDDGTFATEYVKRREFGFYGADSLGRVYPREPGQFFFRRGLKTSRRRVERAFKGMGL